MKIKDKDFYHGVVLSQIVDYAGKVESCGAVEFTKVDNKNGLFDIDGCILLLAKYSTDDEDWHFTFRQDDFAHHTDNDEFEEHDFFIALVCSDWTICVLGIDDIKKVIDVNERSAQWIKVSYPDGGQFRVSGSMGSIDHAIPHNAFPREIFRPRMELQEAYKWPESCKIKIFDCSSEDLQLIHSTDDRDFDLDNANIEIDTETGSSICLAVSTTNKQWKNWDVENLNKIEFLLDNQFDDEYVLNYSQMSVEGAPCTDEFKWLIKITLPENDDEDALFFRDDEDNERLEKNEILDPEIRKVTSDFPRLVLNKRPISSIELALDNISADERFQNLKYDDVFRKAAGKWILDNDYKGTGTIWIYSSLSANFHEPCWSFFFGIVGMPKDFANYLRAAVRVFANYSRPDSEGVTPNLAAGWDAKWHIEDGKLWEPIDDSEWVEVKNHEG